MGLPFCKFMVKMRLRPGKERRAKASHVSFIKNTSCSVSKWGWLAGQGHSLSFSSGKENGGSGPLSWSLCIWSLEVRCGSSRLAVRGATLCCWPWAFCCREDGSWDWQFSPALGMQVLPFACPRESQAQSWDPVLYPPSSDPKPSLAVMSLSPEAPSLQVPPSDISRWFLSKEAHSGCSNFRG